MPKKITMTTCTSYTNFKTVLTVWDGWPGDEDSQQLHYEKYRQTDKCAEIVFEVLAGSYWVVLEGADDQEGDFELLVLCDEHSVLAPTSVPIPVPSPAPTSVPTMAPSWDCISRFYSRMGLNSTNITCTTL